MSLQFIISILNHTFQLLDDDSDVIGTLHESCVMNGSHLLPAKSCPGGHDYLELNDILDEELHEIIGMSLLQ